MAVLSDKTIKERIQKKELIPNGNAKSAIHCSYEFKAAEMLRGGSHESKKVTAEGIVISPAELVWIKANEEIAMPPDMVGLWIQTQTLARQGLLLLNITLIEPGYKGPLSAVFVNFGKKKVVIGPETKIAKVIFLPLDNDATDLIGKWDSKTYDTNLMDMAANAPETFLQLESFLPNIETKAKQKLDDIDDEIKKKVDNAAKEIRKNFKNDLQADVKGAVLKWGGVVFLGLAVGFSLVLFGFVTLLPRLSSAHSRVEKLAREAFIIQQAETITDLRTKFDLQEKKIETIRKQLLTISSTVNKTQLQDKAAVTLSVPDTKQTNPKQ